MNIADHSLKVAALDAIIRFFTAEYKTAREEAEAAYLANKVRKATIETPSGDELGDITIKQPTSTVVMDEEKLLAWVAEHTPAEVEEYLDSSVLLDEEAIAWAREHRDDLIRRRVRKVWRSELEKTALTHDGHVFVEDTGDATKVGEVVKQRPSGAFALPPDKGGERSRRLMAALLAGELTGITTLQIAAPDGGDGDE
jgi:hypothetical protein